MKDWILKPVVYRTAVIVYVTSLVVLFGVYVAVALWDVEYSAYIQGSKQMTRNMPHLMRGQFSHAQTGRSIRRAKKVSVGLLPEDTPKIEDVYPALLDEKVLTSEDNRLHINPGPVHFTFEPKVKPGKYQFVVRVNVDGDGSFESRTPVLIEEGIKTGSPWLKHMTRKSTHEQEILKRGAFDHSGPIHIDVIPSKPELIRGLTSPVYFVTYKKETGKPVPCLLKWAQKSGMLEHPLPNQVQTDAMGLAKLDVTPMLTQRWMMEATCTGEETPSKATIHLETIASQIALKTAQPIAQVGMTIPASVISLHRNGWFYADLIVEETWRSGNAFGLGPRRSGARIKAPDDRMPDIALAQFQVSMDMYLPGKVWDMRYVVIQKQEDSTKAVEFVLNLLKTHDLTGLQTYWQNVDMNVVTQAPEVTRRRWLNAMLFALPRHFAQPNNLLNSLSIDRDVLEAKKAGIRKDLIVVISMAMGLGLLFLLLAVAQAMQTYRARQKLIEDVALETALLEDGDMDESIDLQEEASAAKRQSRQLAMMWIQGIVILGTIAVFGAMIIMLLRFL